MELVTETTSASIDEKQLPDALIPKAGLVQTLAQAVKPSISDSPLKLETYKVSKGSEYKRWACACGNNESRLIVKWRKTEVVIDERKRKHEVKAIHLLCRKCNQSYDLEKLYRYYFPNNK